MQYEFFSSHWKRPSWQLNFFRFSTFADITWLCSFCQITSSSFTSSLNLKWDINFAHHLTIKTYLSELCDVFSKKFSVIFQQFVTKFVLRKRSYKFSLQLLPLTLIFNCLSPITKFRFPHFDPVFALQACGPYLQGVSRGYQKTANLTQTDVLKLEEINFV